MKFCKIHEIITPKKDTQSSKSATKLPKSQFSKNSQVLSLKKLIWSQQVEQEEEKTKHIFSSIFFPRGPVPIILNKMLSLFVMILWILHNPLRLHIF